MAEPSSSEAAGAPGAAMAEPGSSEAASAATAEPSSSETAGAAASSAEPAQETVSLHVSCKEFLRLPGEKLQKWLLERADVPLQEVFKLQSWNYAFVKMLPEHVEKFKEAVHGVNYRRAEITVKDGKPRGQKNSRGDGDEPGAKRRKGDGFPAGYTPTLKDLKDKLNKKKERSSVLEKSAPLLIYSYETQLSMKGVYVKSAVRSFTKGMEKQCKDLALDPPPWISFEWSKKIGAPLGCACPLDDVIGTPAESIEGYRNKCEFSIAMNEAGEVDVGFVLRTTDEGMGRIVASCEQVPLVPLAMKQLCEALRDCVRASPYGVFMRGKDFRRGTWRMAMARLSPAGELLVLVQTITLSDEDKEKISGLIVNALLAAPIKVVSIYLQFNDESTDAARPGAPLFLIHGLPQLRMELLGLKFDIGPLSFYQANSATCELLYSRALDWARPRGDIAMLDICCGVGTIGLCASRRCKQVVGIELIPEAVESAKTNAKLNGLQNTTWKAGRAEEVLPEVLKDLDPTLEVCAIVDPPRPGLHASVLNALRSCAQLSRIVYVSCNPESLAEDVVKLTLPRESEDDPFVPVRAVGVDMFPHTLHCEMILLLERSSKVSDPGKNLEDPWKLLEESATTAPASAETAAAAE